jgi:flavodoxin
MSTLVTYFSAEGTTAKLAKEYAEKIGADLFEIVPEVPYSAADIRWINPLARCNKEQLSKKDVPVKGKIESFDQYDTVYIGFPIWYGAAPRVVYSFCKDYNWSGKTIHAFATSGGSGIGKTADKLSEYVSGAASVDAKLVHSASEI